MKTTIVLIVLVVLGALGYYMFRGNSTSTTYSPTPSTSSENGASNSSAPTSQGGTSVQTETTVQTSAPVPVVTAPQAVSVNIKNFAFGPTSLSVKAGTKVTWTNNDSMSHTVTSDSGSLLNSGTIAPGQSWSFTFASAGTVSYHCAFHPNMKGTVVVTN